MGATKCIKCGSYQDWTRHVLRWSAVIIAALGLVPLWGIATSLHQIAFARRGPAIEAALISCAHAAMTVAYVNAGGVDGIVTEHAFVLEHGGSSHTPPYAVRPDTTGDFLVSPGQPAKLVRLRAYIGGVETNLVSPGHGLSGCRYRLTVLWSEFKDRKHRLERTCPCPA
jgi:hypothetical protein